MPYPKLQAHCHRLGYTNDKSTSAVLFNAKKAKLARKDPDTQSWFA